ncbi:DNA-binding protein HU [Candidatus Entotheonellaceae bacterium PAL068K]
MTEAELINDVVKTSPGTDLSKKVTGELVDAVFAAIGRVIQTDDRFLYPGFGTFTVKNRATRQGRNPKTGAEIRIKASKTVEFKPAPRLKKSL